ncbi:MAG: ThiF family adenylyltransferase [Kiritimatiellia bacterium]
MDTERTERLVGAEAIARIRSAKILLMGLGGVGSWCAEALIRAGVEHIGLVDFDVVSASNFNRQLGALRSTLGRRKVDVIRERILDINPNVSVKTFPVKFTAETAKEVPLADWDVVIDAIDLVSAKVHLAVCCSEANIPLYSAMGGGNKLDPERFTITDLASTNRCPLAKIMRKRLRKFGIVHGRVVASDEEPRLPLTLETGRFVAAGTLSTVVGTEGLLLAHAVLRDLIGKPVAPLGCDAHGREAVQRRLASRCEAGRPDSH